MKQLCGDVIQIGDFWYGTQYGFWCELPKGHSGPHREISTKYESRTGRSESKTVMLTVEWEQVKAA